MKKSIAILCGALCISLAAGAQVTLEPSVIAAGGDYAESGQISISWTLGELAVSTLAGENMILTQGFQQPFDVGVGTGPEAVNWNISVYPNPVRDVLTIRFGIEKAADFLIQVQDVTGRVLAVEQNKNILPGDIVQLNTSGYSEGVYFVKLFAPNLNQVKVVSINKR